MGESTTEVVPYAPFKLRRVKPAREGKWELECEGFTLRNKFPDNVVRLFDESFFVIESIEEIFEFRFMLSGRRFGFCANLHARSTDYFKVSDLSDSVERVSSRELMAKCYAFPLVEDTDLYKCSGIDLDPSLNPDVPYAVSVLM